MATQDKKQVIRDLLEQGKAKGKLTTKEITDALEELDLTWSRWISSTTPWNL